VGGILVDVLQDGGVIVDAEVDAVEARGVQDRVEGGLGTGRRKGRACDVNLGAGLRGRSRIREEAESEKKQNPRRSRIREEAESERMREGPMMRIRRERLRRVEIVRTVMWIAGKVEGTLLWWPSFICWLGWVSSSPGDN
jgi:hypothetical protein